MIATISGISTSIPNDYDEIKRRLRMLGLSPTGNPQLDKSRLQQAINNKIEKLEEKKEEMEDIEERSIKKQLEEERLGAQALAEQNKFFFGL